MDKESVCIYCGCACRLKYEVEDNKIINVKGVKTDDVSEGFPCVKGLTIHECYDRNKITSPLIRIAGVQYESSINKALKTIIEKTKDLASNEVFFNTSGKITNEDNYVIQKFARVCFKTPNIDSCCGRLCHNATVMGMKNVYGTPNLTVMNKINEIDTLLIIGSEPEKDYPVFYNKISRNNIKLLRVHSFIKGCSESDCILAIKPGSETCFINGIINELIRKGITSNIEGFNILKNTVSNYNKRYVCRTCGIEKEDYINLVNQVFVSESLGVFHGMGLTQHVNSLENVHSLLNLVLLKKAIILSLRGEINVQGAGDLGGMPGLLPTGSLNTKELIEQEWGSISDFKGLNIIEALALTPVKALFLTEFNPLKSMPDTELLKEKLEDSFIVYFGSHHNETSRRADVVIPIASLLESEGTITNGERRLRKVNRVIKGNPQLWTVLKNLSEMLGKKKYFNYDNTKKILSELISYVKDYQLISVNKLWQGIDEWAIKEKNHERFMPEHFEGLDDITSRTYPFTLTTFRSRASFLGNEVTGYSETLSKIREPIGFYLSLIDMRKMKLMNGDEVIVSSATNSLTGKAFSSDRLPKGIIGAYMHYSELPINKLFPLKFDEESFTPNYKCVSVNIKKV